MSLRKAAECVKRNKSFLITSHMNLEGDALGSELAFSSMLNKLGKKVLIVNDDAIPYGYGFLPGQENIRRMGKDLKKVSFDCLVVLDCSDLFRTGAVAGISALYKKPVLNIDHHISNLKFGQVNWVEPQASSCSEMIYKLYKALKVPLDRDSALCLYVGMLTDTGSFRYSNTHASTHQAVAELLRFDLDIPQAYKNIYENVPFADMELLTRILPTMRREPGGKIIWFQLKRSLLKKKKISFDLSEHILSFGRAIKGIEVVVFFKENLGHKGEVRVNFRSQGKVDVNKIAAFFGGGGHKTASGATIRGKIDPVRKKVLAKIKESLK